MTWHPTMELRWHHLVVAMSWSTQWDENIKVTLQQKWVSESGVEEWRELPIFKEEVKNMQLRG